ncbi:uncharacterized protein METZ01_LOCUS42470, partial [marine metagenome]
VLVCHCSQCRRSSGHLWAATAAPVEAIEIDCQNTLSWYRSSSKAKRGFCRRCGSSLFWQLDGSTSMSVAAGSLDVPTGLSTQEHIYFDHASDYYTVNADELIRMGTETVIE